MFKFQCSMISGSLLRVLRALCGPRARPGGDSYPGSIAFLWSFYPVSILFLSHFYIDFARVSLKHRPFSAEIRKTARRGKKSDHNNEEEQRNTNNHLSTLIRSD
jgi:hypothetical protein